MLPVPAPASSTSKEAKRNVFCRNYNGCMTQALKSQWESFTCGNCPLRGRDSAPRADAYLLRTKSQMDPI